MMNKIKIDKQRLLRKFKTLSVASDCIQRTAKYLYQFYKSSNLIVDVWLQALNSAKTDAGKVSLFYIANEILQSKCYGHLYFKKSWKPHLIHSINLLKDSSVNDKIRRILHIWIERKVYDHIFIRDLIDQLSTLRRTDVHEDYCKNIINFEPGDAIEKLKESMKMERETSEIIRTLETSINFDEKLSIEAIKNLKDKSQCNKFTEQLDNNINQLFKLCAMLEEELRIRQGSFEIMNDADIYYETQHSETLVVEDAYRRYGNQISKTKETLEERLESMVDDGGFMDAEDAPSPGRTPPHLYDDVFRNMSNVKNSPISSDDVTSPTQSLDLSEEDTSTNKSNKLYSPSRKISSSNSLFSASKTSLSNTDALKLLTSVFNQSLTKKPTKDATPKVNIQSDIFRNTLEASKTTNETNKNVDKLKNPDAVFENAFRLISNLTGLKTVSERTLKSDSFNNAGTTIPILTSKMPFTSNEEDDKSMQTSYPFLQQNLSSANVLNSIDTIPRLLYPDIQNTSFPLPFYNPQHMTCNPMFPIFSNTSVPPPSMPMIFNAGSNNALGFNLTTMKQNNLRTSQSFGSCTEDDEEGGATPTQDEPAFLHSAFHPNVFNSNVLPVLAAGAAEINKQIQNAMNAGSNAFSLHNMLSVQKDGLNTNSLQPCTWTGMAAQYPMNMVSTNVQANMNMPFSIINQNAQIQPFFTATSSATHFGPPRAIRARRPNGDSVSTLDEYDLSNFYQTPPPTQSEHGSTQSNNQIEDLESILAKDVSKKVDDDGRTAS